MARRISARNLRRALEQRDSTALLESHSLAELYSLGGTELITEAPMFKQMVVVSSLLAGIGSAGMAMYLQVNPLALNRGNRVDLDTYLYSAKTEPLPKLEVKASSPAVESEQADVVRMPEVIVTRARPGDTRAPSPSDGTGSRGQGFAVDPANREPTTSPTPDFDQQRDTTPAVTPRELRPCSKFRELGPMHVDDGVPTGTRGVRDLC